jgi:hypothetical protein
MFNMKEDAKYSSYKQMIFRFERFFSIRDLCIVFFHPGQKSSGGHSKAFRRYFSSQDKLLFVRSYRDLSQNSKRPDLDPHFCKWVFHS